MFLLQIHREIVSTSPYLLIHFVSDDTINNKGFLANYRLASHDEESVVYTYTPTSSYSSHSNKDKTMKRTEERVEKYPFLQQ